MERHLKPSHESRADAFGERREVGAEQPLDLFEEDSRKDGDGSGPVGEEAVAAAGAARPGEAEAEDAALLRLLGSLDASYTGHVQWSL